MCLPRRIRPRSDKLHFIPVVQQCCFCSLFPRLEHPLCRCLRKLKDVNLSAWFYMCCYSHLWLLCFVLGSYRVFVLLIDVMDCTSSGRRCQVHHAIPCCVSAGYLQAPCTAGRSSEVARCVVICLWMLSC